MNLLLTAIGIGPGDEAITPVMIPDDVDDVVGCPLD